MRIIMEVDLKYSYTRLPAPTVNPCPGVLGKCENVRIPTNKSEITKRTESITKTTKNKMAAVYYALRHFKKAKPLAPIIEGAVDHALNVTLEPSPASLFNNSKPVRKDDVSGIELLNKYAELDDELDQLLLDPTVDVVSEVDKCVAKQDEFKRRNLKPSDWEQFDRRYEVMRGLPVEKPTTHEMACGGDCEDFCCDPMPSNIEIQCDIGDHKTDEYTSSDELTAITSRKIRKFIRNSKYVTSYSKLTWYLRSKYFMMTRDRSLINKMSNDARIWMLKTGHTCETEADFVVMTSSIMAAFLVNTQEMDFRALMKNKVNYDNMVHHNAAVQGDLGKTSWFKKPAESIKPSFFLPSMALPNNTPRA
jgi:hypothetical protein